MRSPVAASSNLEAVLTAPATPDGDRRRFAEWFARSSLRLGSYVAFAAVLLVFAWRAPSFLSIGNIGNILGQSAILGVLAFGMTIVIVGGGSNVVTGGIDLSLAANMGLTETEILISVELAASPNAFRRRGQGLSPKVDIGGRFTVSLRW
jgi:ABC-type xylose transport system permease subunit